MQSRSFWGRTIVGLFVSMLLVATSAVAQQDDPYAIRGVVRDADTSAPLAGVSVLIRGAGVGTLTDADGRYELRADVSPGRYTLAFELIGRSVVTRVIELDAERTVTVDPVSMEQTAVQLEEIVVTGSGVSATRRAVANSVESVSGDEVGNAPAATTIDQALQGKVTGAVINETSGQPGGGVSIRLRGTSSINGGAEPLIVVDGLIIDNNDEALVSLGANAGRGSADLSNRLADLVPADIERIEILKGPAAAALYGSRANNGVVQIFTRRGTQGEPKITFRTEASLSAAAKRYDLLDYPYAGLGDVVFAGADSVGQPVERHDVQDDIFRTGSGTTNHLSISGGNESTSYYVAGSWTREDGIIRATDHDKKSGRINLSQRLTDELRVDANANFVQSHTGFMTEGEQTQGVLTTAIFQPTAFDFGFDEDLGRYPYGPILGTNPLDVIENWEFPQDVTRFLGSFEASWTPLEDLSIRYLAGIDDYRQESKYFQPARSTSAGDPGRVSKPVRLSRQINSDVTATHALEVNGSLSLGSTLGFRYTSDRGETVALTATDLPPGQKTVGGANQFASQYISEYHTVGGFVQERLSVSDRLFITGGLNLEASSAFGSDQRWQFFPRAGASWVVHEEPFWGDGPFGDVLSTLRLRLAYGETGGQPPGIYSRFNNYGDVALTGKPGLVPSSLSGNPELKPEREREYEAGIDAGLFGDRVDLSLTYYDQETSDLVLSVPQPLSSGFSSRFENIGVVSNHGVEISLNTVNVRRSGFTWTSSVSYSANRNRVEQLVTATDSLQYGYLNYVIEGEPIGVYYGLGYERDANGEIVIDPATGLGELSSERRILGNPNPDFYGTLGNDFAIGDDIVLNVLVDGSFGNEVANFTRRITEFFGADAVVGEEIERAIELKDDPSLQPISYTLNGDRIANYEEYVENGSYMKVREVALRYTLPPSWLQRLGPEGVTLRLAARNLYTWTNYSGLDPETNLFAGNTVARGVDFAVTPLPRTVVFGATLNF